MKTLFAKTGTKNFNFSFDVLTSTELSLVKGGKEIDIWIDPAPRLITAPLSTLTTTVIVTDTRTTKKV